MQVTPFDRDALSAAVAGQRVVRNLATAIPTGEQAGRGSAWKDNHRIRRESARNLVAAALPGGADRYIRESSPPTGVTSTGRVGSESYIGEWLPEPIPTEPSPLDPLDTVERRESVSLATLRMTENAVASATVAKARGARYPVLGVDKVVAFFGVLRRHHRDAG